jgi:hypothetical protein
LTSGADQSQTDLSNANDNLSAALDDAQIVAAAVQDALEAADVEGREDLSTVEGVQALSRLIAEYGSKDGDTPTAAYSNGDAQGESNHNIVGGIDISDAMNN